jgi:hypothetical protein
MKCDRVQRALNALADGELGRWTSWRIRRHLRRCADCGQVWQETLRLGEHARAWRSVSAPPVLRSRVAAALAAGADQAEGGHDSPESSAALRAGGAHGDPDYDAERLRGDRRRPALWKERIWMMTVRWGWIGTVVAVLVALWVGSNRGGSALAAAIEATAGAPAVHYVATGDAGTRLEFWMVAGVGSYLHSQYHGSETITIDDLKYEYRYEVDTAHVQVRPSEMAKPKEKRPLGAWLTGTDLVNELQQIRGTKDVTVKTVEQDGRRLRQIAARGFGASFYVDPQTDLVVRMETRGGPSTAPERLRFEYDYPDPAAVDRRRFRFEFPAGVTVDDPTGTAPHAVQERAPDGAAPAAAPDSACAGRVRQLSFALRMYSEDYDDRLPPMKTAAQVEGPLSAYVRYRDRPIFACPVTKVPYQPNPAVSGRLITKVSQDTPLLWDARPHPDGLWTIGYLDSRVERQKRAPRIEK